MVGTKSTCRNQLLLMKPNCFFTQTEMGTECPFLSSIASNGWYPFALMLVPAFPPSCNIRPELAPPDCPLPFHQTHPCLGIPCSPNPSVPTKNLPSQPLPPLPPRPSETESNCGDRRAGSPSEEEEQRGPEASLGCGVRAVLRRMSRVSAGKEGAEYPDGACGRPVLVEDIVYPVRAGYITLCHPPNYFVKETGHG